MKMAELPGTIYSPLSENIKTKAMRITSTSSLMMDIEAMEVGETIVVPTGYFARNLNQKHGLGTYSSKKMGDRHYLTRNK